MIANTRISNLVQSQVPFFVRNDHQNFIQFIEAYYEWLEQEDNNNADKEQYNVVNRAKNILSYRNVDETIQQFSEILYDTFLKSFPDNILADKNLILKHVKDFYRSRGTEKSIRFLLRILYGIEDVDIYYPKKDILRASDGKWFIEKSLKIKNVFLDGVLDDSIPTAKLFEGTRIKGNTSNAIAVVEKIDTYFQYGTLVRELKLSGQIKDFQNDEIIFTTFEQDGVIRTLYANAFSGIVVKVNILNPGTGYRIGNEAVVESDTGSGAIVRVTDVRVDAVNLTSIFVINGGAGFKVDDVVSIIGGGTGATANVIAVVSDGKSHPNSYNIAYSTISLEANTVIGSAAYANLSSANANTTIANAISFFEYSNTGPIQNVYLITAGSGYTASPFFDVQSNSRIRALQTLGKMEIIDGGSDYQINDTIEFINVLGGYGSGASANVKNVDANGAITEVQFVEVPGHIVGGSGYNKLPKANVISTSGAGADIIVTAVLGNNETLFAQTIESGSISELSVIFGGGGYTTPPTINLQSVGNGDAIANSEIITGVFTYPGRWLNDDGHLSSYNFLEDRDYYQNFSYVIRVKESINKYKQALLDLIHPSGMKIFGEYTFVDNGETLNPKFQGTETTEIIFTLGKYQANLGNIVINTSNHGLVSGDIVYLEFVSGNTTNVTNGVFTVDKSNTNYFNVIHNKMTINTSGNVYTGITKD